MLLKFEPETRPETSYQAVSTLKPYRDSTLKGARQPTQGHDATSSLKLQVSPSTLIGKLMDMSFSWGSETILAEDTMVVICKFIGWFLWFPADVPENPTGNSTTVAGIPQNKRCRIPGSKIERPKHRISVSRTTSFTI